jgi:hypothetical protein
VPLLGVALAIALAIALVTPLAGSGGAGPTPAQAAVKKHHRVHHQRHHNAARPHGMLTAAENDENRGERESSAGEPPGEPSPGHEDSGANADHQCPPSCDTAAGEQP